MSNKLTWVKNLPPGIYDTQQLREKSGLRCIDSIKQLMVSNGAMIEKLPCGKRDQHKKLVFYWDGIKPPSASSNK